MVVPKHHDADDIRKAKTKKKTSSAGRRSSAGGRKKLTEFNKFMQTEVARLKREKPDLPHKDRFKEVIANWNSTKGVKAK